MSLKTGLQGSSKSTTHRLSIKRNWNTRQTGDHNNHRLPRGMWYYSGHNGQVCTKTLQTERETKAKLSHSSHSEWAVWHYAGLHLLGIKLDTQKHKSQSGNSWSDVKLNSMWDKGKRLSRNQIPKHNWYPSVSLTMLLELNDWLKSWTFNILGGRVWFKTETSYQHRFT